MEIENGRIIFTTEELGQAFGVTGRRIRQLGAEGVITALGRNKWDLADAIQGYLNFQIGGAESTKEISKDYHVERALLTKAKRKTAEIELDKLRGAVHDAEDIKNVISRMIMAFRARLLAMPTKMAPLLLAQTELTKIQDLIRSGVYECLSELSEYNPADFAGQGTVSIDGNATDS